MPRRRLTSRVTAIEMLADPTRSLADIARQLGVSRERVRQIAAETGAVPRSPVRQRAYELCHACKDEIVAARMTGESYASIAAQIGTTEETLRLYCKSIGMNSRALQAARVDQWVALYTGVTTGHKMTVEQVSEHTGWSYMEIYRQLSRRGVIRPLSESARMRHAREKKERT